MAANGCKNCALGPLTYRQKCWTAISKLWSVVPLLDSTGTAAESKNFVKATEFENVTFMPHFMTLLYLLYPTFGKKSIGVAVRWWM